MADVRKGSRLWITIGLGLYAGICLMLFIWMRFPYDSLKYRLEDALSGFFRAPVILGHIEPSLFRGFRIEGVEVGGTQVARMLTVSPKPWQILRGSLGFGYHADLVAGTVEGLMSLPYRKRSRPMELTLDMAAVDLNGLSRFFPPGVRPSGIVSGELSLTAPRDSIDKAVGALALSWKKGSLPLGMPSLPFDALTFENLELESSIDKGLLSIEKIEFTGDFSGTMTGSIRLSPEVRRSRLNISGEVTLPESMRQSLGAADGSPGQGSRFSLRGTIESPRFRMLDSYADRGQRSRVTAPGSSLQMPSRVPRTMTERPRREIPSARQAAPSSAQEVYDDLEPDDVDLQQPVEPEGE